MPWTVSDPPAPARGASLSRRRACVGAANNVLERTGDEGRAVAACIAAMRRVNAEAEVEFKALRFEFKADPESGTIEGYASAFGNVDEQGDIIVRGAFKESLATAKAAGRALKMLWRHSTPIGVWDTAKEDAKGLFVSGRPLVEDVPQAREAVALAKAGAVDELSVGIIVRESDRSKDGMVRRITKAELKEVSLVPFAANPLARVTAVKCGGGADCGCTGCKEGLASEAELAEALVAGRQFDPELAARVAKAAWPRVYSRVNKDLEAVGAAIKQALDALR